MAIFRARNRLVGDLSLLRRLQTGGFACITLLSPKCLGWLGHRLSLFKERPGVVFDRILMDRQSPFRFGFVLLETLLRLCLVCDVRHGHALISKQMVDQEVIEHDLYR